jgi:hypothetical protein
MHNSPPQSSPLLSNLSSIITTQGYISPSIENLSFLMNSSPTIKNLLTFSLNALSNYNSLKQAKSSLSFYNLYQDKIQHYHNLKQTKENKLKELQSKRQLLSKLKSKKAELLSTNRSLLSTINAHSNKETFSNIKAKILSLGQLKVTSLLKQLNNFAALENVKYDHCYFGKDYHNKAITTQNTVEFDINQHLQNTSHELSIINNDSLLSNVNDTTSQPVPLPKLSVDDVMKYTPITQDAYAKEIQQKLRVLMQHKSSSSSNNDDAISLSTCSNNNNCINDITNTFKDIVNAVITDIQKEEERISLQYNETAETYNDAIASTQSENKTLITTHNIPQAHIQIIKQLTLGKIFKDLSRSYQQFNDVADEFELPKCFISKDTPLKFAHLANIIKTYKKLLMRTDGFILKRLLPLGVCLEDKCTDMWNVIHTENDYFIKMNYNTFTNNNNNTICDINDYKYDKHILKEFNVYSKYDIYTYFCKYLYHYKYMNTCSTNIKRKTDLIYNNKYYQTFLKQSKDTLKEVETFIKGVNYNQEYKLMYNKSLIPQMAMLINEFKDIKYISYS